MMPITAFVVLVLLNLVNTNSNLITDFQQACPYTNFCTIPSLKTFNGSNDVTPCCYDCFCDEDCWAYGDCCPDLDVNYTSSRGLSVKLECKRSYIDNAFAGELYARNLLEPVQHHRIIDFCPGRNSVNSVVNRKCEDNDDDKSDYDDVTLVSDDKSRIFKNKHCARCHGVTDFVRWKLAITFCRNKLDTLQLKLSQITFYVLNNCVITFQRPNNVPLNGRTLTCSATTCDFKGRDQILWQKCEEAPHSLLNENHGHQSLSFIAKCYERNLRRGTSGYEETGPILDMPYFDISRHGIMRMYKNFYCALCNGPTFGPTLCSIPDMQQEKSLIISLTVLLNPITDTIQTRPPVQSKCGEGMIYDTHKKGCRRFYCPPFEVAGNDKCIKMSEDITDLYVSINILFPVSERNIIHPERQSVMYNNSLTEHYSKLLLSKFGLVYCEMYSLVVTLYKEKTTKRIFAILAAMQFRIKGKCSLAYLANVIKISETRIVRIAWALNDMVLDLRGHVSFFNSFLLREEYEWNLLIYTSIQSGHVDPLTSFFLCRYVTLNLNEYNVKVGSTNYTLPDELSKLSTTTQLLPGFYAVSENEIAVCVETYMPSVSGSGHFLSCELSIITLTVIFCITKSL